jgi:hypothetical protein
MRRRLLKYDVRIFGPRPSGVVTEGRLLVQFAARGAFFADLALLKRYLPGLAYDDADDPALSLLREIRESGIDVREMMRELIVRLSAA